MPRTPEQAWASLDRILRSPTLAVLHPGSRFVPLLREAMAEARASGNLVFDAQVVALCREAGVRRLLTEDRDFGRFADFPTEGLPAPLP